MKRCFERADILLPDFEKEDGGAWAVIACDQHTGEPEYWADAEKCVGDKPSTLRVILPEVYLNETEQRVPLINQTMKEYLDGVLTEHKDTMIYLERTLSDGSVRRGLIGKIDLEEYDYTKGSKTLIRATEGTVLERIPPRVAIRRGAAIELPHVMILIDDPGKTVIEPLSGRKENFSKAYGFELMLGGGSVEGYFLDGFEMDRVSMALDGLITPDAMREKYGEGLAPLLFAVGDGNHSLAAAKAAYEEVKAKLGEKAKDHPARYALVEVVNLHDDSLRFEPIYRVMSDVDPEEVKRAFSGYIGGIRGTAGGQRIEWVAGSESGAWEIPHPEKQLAVGTLQTFIDGYLKEHPKASVDYIHGEEVTRMLAAKENAIGFLFEGMAKSELFRTVLYDGALPRKTFSMGHAQDKRYYLEARRIME